MITLSFDDTLVTQLTMYCFHRKTNDMLQLHNYHNTKHRGDLAVHNQSVSSFIHWLICCAVRQCCFSTKTFLGSNPTVSYCQSFVIIYSRAYTQINAGQDKSTKAAVGKDRALSHLDDIIMTSSPVNTSMHVDTRFPRIHTWCDK